MASSSAYISYSKDTLSTWLGSSLSFEVVYKATSLHTSNTAIFSMYGPFSPTYPRFGFHIRGSTENPSGSLNFWVSGSSSYTAATADVSSNFGDSTWHHLVGVIDRSSGQFFTYVDGVQEASGTIPSMSGSYADSNTDIIAIGGNHLARYLNAQISTVRLWSKALSSTEVVSAMANPEGVSSEVFSLLKLDGDANDSSGNNNHATAHNVAWIAQ